MDYRRGWGGPSLVFERWIGTEVTGMYLVGKGHDHDGPGTSMVQRINWTKDQERQLTWAMQGRGYRLGSDGRVPECRNDCSSMSGSCRQGYGMSGCECKSCGMGLFESLNPQDWSLPVWTLAIGGASHILRTVFSLVP